MGEIIKINFNNEKSKEKSQDGDDVADVIDFKQQLEKKNELMKREEEIEDIIKKSNKNEDGTYELKLDLKLENSKRGTLKDYLMSQGLRFFSIDNGMNTNDSGIGFDLDIKKDQISDLLAFLKEEGIAYTPIEQFTF